MPAEWFFRKPLLSNVRLSPDGSKIAALRSFAGQEVLIVRDTRGGEIQPVGELSKGGMAIRRFDWSGNDRLVVSVSMPASWRGQKRRRTRLVVVDVEKKKRRILDLRDGIQSYLPADPDHILIRFFTSPVGSRLSRIHLRTENQKSFAAKEPLVFGWYLDAQDRARAASGTFNEMYRFRARIDPEDRLETISEFHVFEGNGIRFAGFHEDPGLIYVYSDQESGRFAVYEFDLREKKLGRKIFAHAEVDAGRLQYQPGTDRLVGVSYTTDRVRYHFLDPDFERLHKGIRQALGGAAYSTRRGDLQWKFSRVYASSDLSPTKLYVFDREEKKLHYLMSAFPELDGKRLAPMKPVTFPARDGLPIPGYLTLPLDVEPKGLPAIVVVHGGPSSRDTWGFDPLVQFLANRGFAVLQPNFRGSTGYGSEFYRAGWKEWGLAMQDDVTDGVKWLVEQGIADPKRVGIYGASYGGYSTLIGAVKTPDLYAAAASFAAPTDLLQLLDDEAALGQDEYNKPTIGGSWTDRASLKENSPARRAREIRVPVLLAHGELDPVVHQRHAKQMRRALKKALVEHEYYLYEDEVHGFLNEDNQIDFYKKLGAFFERHLKSEPARAAGDDVVPEATISPRAR